MEHNQTETQHTNDINTLQMEMTGREDAFICIFRISASEKERHTKISYND